MKCQSQVKYLIVLMVLSVNFKAPAEVKEALKFACEGIDKAIEIAPKVKKRKSFDSRSFYPNMDKIFYRVSMKRDTTGDIIIKSAGFSGIDEVEIEIRASRLNKIDGLQNAVISAWGMVNKKGFIKSNKRTDKVEARVGDYIVEINVKFEGPLDAEVKIAKIKIKVRNPQEEFESGTVKAIRRYVASDKVFLK